LFRGQPRKIMRLAREVKKLRAFLMVTIDTWPLFLWPSQIYRQRVKWRRHA
jgi:hypothetical protein